MPKLRLLSFSLLVFCCAGFPSGCAYLENRKQDLYDVVWVDGSFGFGIQADFQVTELVHSGFGVHFCDKNGFYRGQGHRWCENGYGLFFNRHIQSWLKHPGPLIRSGYLVNVPGILDMCSGEHYFSERTEKRVGWNPERPFLNALDVDFGLYLVCVNCRVGLSPGEFVDFLAGWFGIDVGVDDVVYEEDDSTEKK